MGVIEDVQRMRSEGKSDDDIAQTLQQQGISPQQVYEAMQQAVIKDAVTSDATQQSAYDESMQPSIGQSPQADYSQQYSQQDQQDYSQQNYSQGLSSETIAEIAEQAIVEKMSLLRADLEKILDFKNSTDAKMEMFDERIKRIEKIIDRLQLSILQKVGEYMTNVEDLKKELLETQKTFTTVTKARPSSHSKDKEE